MKLRNLDKNILFVICEELSRRDHCGPLEASHIYRTFSDIPHEQITSSIEWLVGRGWLQQDKGQTEFYLTDSGWSEIHSFLPKTVVVSCKKPKL